MGKKRGLSRGCSGCRRRRPASQEHVVSVWDKQDHVCEVGGP